MIPLPESVIDGALKAHRHGHRSQSEPEHPFHGANPHQNHEHQHHAKSYQLNRPRGRSKADQIQQNGHRGASVKVAVFEEKEGADSVMDEVVDSMIADEQNEHKKVGGMNDLKLLEADIIASERSYNEQLRVLLNDVIMPIFRLFTE